MNSEIEGIEKRLEAIETSIKELKEMDLIVTKTIVACIAPMELNIAGRTMVGEDAKQFKKVFTKKSKDAEERLDKAKTPEDALKLLVELHKEIADFVRATKVDTADKAMEIAHSFIKKYSPVALPLKAERQDDIWLVDIDVGALAVKVAKVKVDARTGDILNYEIPEKK